MDLTIEFDRIVPAWIDQIAWGFERKKNKSLITGVVYDGSTDLSGIVSEELKKHHKIDKIINYCQVDASDYYMDKEVDIKSAHVQFLSNIDGRHILMVQDLFKSGETARAGMRFLFQYGRPKSVELACLVHVVDDKRKISTIVPTYYGLRIINGEYAETVVDLNLKEIRISENYFQG